VQFVYAQNHRVPVCPHIMMHIYQGRCLPESATQSYVATFSAAFCPRDLETQLHLRRNSHWSIDTRIRPTTWFESAICIVGSIGTHVDGLAVSQGSFKSIALRGFLTSARAALMERTLVLSPSTLPLDTLSLMGASIPSR